MDSSTGRIVIDDDYRCGYCYQLKNDLTDPRTLPCKHVFCHSCISSDYRHGISLECPICRAKHTNLVIKDLPRYTNGKESPCKFCAEIAEMFCDRCSVKLCKQHAKQHDEAFTSANMFCEHKKAVAISEVPETIPKGVKQFCEQHSEEEISRACATCYKALCVECILREKCGDKSHHAEKIGSLSEKLKKELITIMSDLYVKSTVWSDMEKKVNTILADHEKVFGEMKALVDEVTQEQINEIQNKANKIKSKIDDTVKRSTETATKYCAELMAKREATDSVRKSIHTLISLKSDLDVIAEYKATCKTATEACESTPLELSLPFIDIQQLAEQREAEVKISEVNYKTVLPSADNIFSGVRDEDIVEPKALTHTSSSATVNQVNGVTWLPDKSLAVSFYDNLEIRDNALNVKTSHVIDGNVWTVCQFGTDFLALVFDGDYKVKHYSSDFTQERTIISGEFGLDGCHMSIRENNVLVIDHNKKCVKHYLADGTWVLDVDFAPFISHAWGIQFLEDKSFVVSDRVGDKVLKFRLEANSSPLWTCEDIHKPTGISIDTSGFIYVASQSKTIYVLTPSGTLIKGFSPPGLYQYAFDISISGNDLVIGSHSGLQLFKIDC